MEIKDFLKEKKKLEDEIVSKICEIIRNFRQRTGLSPCAIYVPMIDATKLGDPEKDFIVGRVETRFSFMD